MKNYFFILFLFVFSAAHSALDENIEISKTFHRKQSPVYVERVPPLEGEYNGLFQYYKQRIEGNPGLVNATCCFAVRLYIEGQDHQREKGRLVGGIETYYIRREKMVEFMDVSILERFQSQGYGTEALETLFGIYTAESRQYLEVKGFLACVGADKRPVHFYKRLGFEKQEDVACGGELFSVSVETVKGRKEISAENKLLKVFKSN